VDEYLNRKLKDVKEQLKLLLSAGGCGLWILDGSADRMTYGKQFAEMLHYAPGELPTDFEGFLSLFAPSDRKKIESMIDEDLTLQNSIDLIVQMITRSGERKWFEFSASSDYDPELKIPRIAGSINDIDEQVIYEKKIEDLAESLEKSKHKLEVSNKLLEEFGYLSAHDLKQPIRGMKTYADILLEDHGGKYNEETKDYLTKISKLADKSLTLIDTLLEYSRVANVDFSKNEVNLNDVVNEVLETMEHEFKEADIDLKLRDCFPTVICDKSRIREVFRNLINNAIKYNDSENKMIEIGCWQGEKGPIIYVRDNGIGIEERNIGRVFKMFQRAHSDKKYTGTGVGLAVVLAIVERHDGAVWVDSKPGEGSAFYFAIGHIPKEYEQWKNKHTKSLVGK
jgi:signal transduction histidine kinase